MTSNAEIWPSTPIDIPPRVKYLITRFFDISDSLDRKSGGLFADELFAEDGTFQTHFTNMFKGHDAIAACRDFSQPHVISRAHHIFRVFAANSPANDLLVLGRFELGLSDGNSAGLDFSARFIITTSNGNTGGEKLQSVRVWTDPAENQGAIDKARAALKAQN